MTGMTKGLKVLLVVEKGSVSLVWNDVVDVCRHHDLPLLEALFTVRVLGDESISQFLPPIRVAARVRIARDLHALLLTPLCCLGLCLGVTPGACLLVAVAVTIAAKNRAVTSRVGAESEERHIHLEKKAPLTQRGPTFSLLSLASGCNKAAIRLPSNITETLAFTF